MLLNIEDFISFYKEMNPDISECHIKAQYFQPKNRLLFEEINSYAKKILGIKYVPGCCECDCPKLYSCDEINEIKTKLNTYYMSNANNKNPQLNSEMKVQIYDMLVGYADLVVR